VCLVVDTCCFAMVFNERNQHHAKFKPIFEWVRFGNGKVIYGGSKYSRELADAGYLGVVLELNKQRRAVPLSHGKVDEIGALLKKSFPETRFDDEHLVAMVIVSKCRIVCTVDKIAMSYLRCPDVFRQHRVERPRIYRGDKRNQELCCVHNIVEVCRSAGAR
jgi:hypothetical protein